MNVSLIITTYNWKQALRKVLDSVKLQTHMPDEVIIADDGSKSDTTELIEEYQQNFPCTLLHCWQPDDGFRAAQNRNNGILASSGDYLIFVDGDMILAPNFIEDHVAESQSGYFVCGRRGHLSKKASARFLNTHNFPKWFSTGVKGRENCLRIFQYLPKAFIVKNSGAVMTFSLGVWRQDLFKINGFNNDFVGWGPEDEEMGLRLRHAGIKLKKVKFKAICYHIYHPQSTRAYLSRNQVIIEHTLKEQKVWCDNGLEQMR